MNLQTTTDPQLTQINLFYKKDFYQNASNYLDAINSYSTELETAINFNKCKVKNDPITSQKEFFVNLDEQMNSMSPQFAAYWIGQFDKSIEEVRNQVTLEIGEGVHYRRFSDAIGCLAKIENYIDDSTQLVSDVTGDNLMTPLRFGSSLTNKLHPSTFLLHGEMSKKTNLVFRRNIKNIQSTISQSLNAHGSNLVPDTEHFKRMQRIIPDINQKIETQFGDLYKVIQYYCNYNPQASTQNLQLVPNYNITVKVEGNELNQDILFNQLQEARSTVTTIGRLKASNTSTTRPNQNSGGAQLT